MKSATMSVDPELVRQHLDRISGSAAFRSSRRCQEFLRFVVERWLDSGYEAIKERTIGVELFGRPSDYDTHEDAIVRVKANEVRKRLANYYAEEGVADELRLDLPPGSYAPVFQRVQHPVPEAASVEPAPSVSVVPVSRWKLRWPWLAGVLAILLLSAAGWLAKRPALDPTDEFWRPALASSKPVVICSGHPVVYFLSRRIHEEYRAKQGINPLLGPYVIQLDPESKIDAKDIVPVRDQYVSVGDASTAAALLSMFARKNKDAVLRFGQDISYSDLRDSPAVLIGFASNKWTLQMSHELRFFFDMEGSVKQIRDRVTGRSWALPNIAPDGDTPVDYAVVSRVLDSRTGQLMITAAGLTQYGSRAAGEFLTHPERMKSAVAGAPSDWASRNMQVLLTTNIIGKVPGPPQVLMVHVW